MNNENLLGGKTHLAAPNKPESKPQYATLKDLLKIAVGFIAAVATAAMITLAIAIFLFLTTFQGCC